MIERLHPDDVARKLFSMLDTAAFVSPSPVAREGKLFASKCKNAICPSRFWHMKRVDSGDMYEVCGLCGAPWGVETIICQMPTTPSWDGAERRMMPFAELAKTEKVTEMFYRSKRWKWQARAYFPYVLHFSGVRGRGGYRALAMKAQKVWPRAPFYWNKDKVANLVEVGRDRYGHVLQQARLIEGGGAWWQNNR